MAIPGHQIPCHPHRDLHLALTEIDGEQQNIRIYLSNPLLTEFLGPLTHCFIRPHGVGAKVP